MFLTQGISFSRFEKGEHKENNGFLLYYHFMQTSCTALEEMYKLNVKILQSFF